jgi:hypothetical protein
MWIDALTQKVREGGRNDGKALAGPDLERFLPCNAALKTSRLVFLYRPERLGDAGVPGREFANAGHL